MDTRRYDELEKLFTSVEEFVAAIDRYDELIKNTPEGKFPVGAPTYQAIILPRKLEEMRYHMMSVRAYPRSVMPK